MPQQQFLLYVPGLHAWLNFHHFVRNVNDTNGDFSRLWVVLTLQEVIHSNLQVTAQLCLGQPYVEESHTNVSIQTIVKQNGEIYT